MFVRTAFALGGSDRHLRLGFIRNEVRWEDAFLDRGSFKPSAGNLAALDLDNGHPMGGVCNQMHDVTNVELHGLLLLHHLARVQPSVRQPVRLQSSASPQCRLRPPRLGFLFDCDGLEGTSGGHTGGLDMSSGQQFIDDPECHHRIGTLRSA